MKDLLLKNGLLFTGEEKSLDKKDILMSNGKIKEISKDICYESPDLEVIDLKEKIVSPGIIDCHTHVGIIEETIGMIGLDDNEKSDPVTPQVRAIDSINPLDPCFRDAVTSGITCIMVTPGSANAVGGWNLATKTYGTIIDKMVVKNPVGFKVAFGEEPINTYGKHGKTPVTRMGIAALIRELFMKTQDYMEEKANGNLKERNIRLESVIPLLENKIPLRAHAHRADDIVTAIRIAEEFNIKKLIIEHGTEAHLIKEYLSEKNISIALGPVLTPRIKMELNGNHYSAATELVKAGIKVALITDHPFNSIDQLRSVAALVISEGLSEKDAFKALTVHPAEILECDHIIGKLDIGFHADIVIYDDDPLRLDSKAMMTIINGKIVFKRSTFT
ncbi:amidohydrolase [Clostridium sp. DJ247]|uniref:amidohydrolase n=1 Tax=Clostridium sp. DJ247 TaxID=2726188 RepID=UPI001624BA67|nr:amidohydrolase [Clostridium sp. DJ247]MBC2582486.1 amidohydrolase [Clostridium sp. DJ247]